MHESTFIVRSTQVDSFGHLNSCAYLEIYEWARWEWWAVNGLDLNETMRVKRRGPVLLRADVHFTRELRIGEPVLVRTWLHEATRARAVFAQEMCAQDGSEASSARMTFVLIDLDRHQAVPMAREILQLHAADEAYRAERRAAEQ